MEIATLVPLVYFATDLLKRFISKKYKKTLTPVVSLIGGVGAAWMTGGYSLGLDVLATGLGAGASAVVGYDLVKGAGNAVTGDK